MTEERIQQYLLGELGEEELEQFELLLLEDPNLHFCVEEKETDLIHSYLRNELFPFEQDYFEREKLKSSRLRERLKIEKLILEKIVAQPENHGIVVSLINRFNPYKKHDLSAIGVFGVGSLRKAAGMILAVGIGLGGWYFYRQSSATSAFDGGMAALKQAAAEKRFAHGRISGFDYSEYEVAEGKRGASDGSHSNPNATIALGRFTEAQKVRETAQNLRGIGLAHLANERYEEAINQLKEAHKTDITNPEILNDLGVAYQQQAEQYRDGDSLEDAKRVKNLTLAMDYFALALKEKSENYPEALFNKGIVQSQIPMLESASVTLNDYLKIDSTSKWAEEARKVLSKVDEKKNK